METYCVSCKKNTTSKNFSVTKARQNRLMLVPNCPICGKKKLRFIKHQEECGFLSKFDIRIPLSNIPLTGNILS